MLVSVSLFLMNSLDLEMLPEKKILKSFFFIKFKNFNKTKNWIKQLIYY